MKSLIKDCCAEAKALKKKKKEKKGIRQYA